MAVNVANIVEIITRQGGQLLPVSPEISLTAATLDWLHRDPFDRMIAATAIANNLMLISADSAFDELTGQPNWPGRIW